MSSLEYLIEQVKVCHWHLWVDDEADPRDHDKEAAGNVDLMIKMMIFMTIVMMMMFMTMMMMMLMMMIYI